MRIYIANSKISLENIFHSIEYDIVWKFPAQFLADVIYNIVFTFLKVHFIAYIIYNSLLMATFPLCQLSYSCIYYCHGTGYNSGMNTRKCVYVLEYVLISLTLMFMWYSFEMTKSNDDMASFLQKSSDMFLFSRNHDEKIYLYETIIVSLFINLIHWKGMIC